MTKTMDINEIVSKLKEHDGELTVKVWSQGADKAYPISHVGQGHTDGVLDTYVSIVVDDDRNLVDLSKIWHDASEEPEGNNWKILCQDESNGCWVENRVDAMLLHNSWGEYAEIEMLVRWAYVSDILPKGGKK